MKSTRLLMIFILGLLATISSRPTMGQQPESLLIAPGDLIHVQVFQVPELEQKSRVQDNGDLALIMGGEVKLAGLSPASAARVIEADLLAKNLVLHPNVLVTIDEYTTSKVTVFGQVKTPGAYLISTPRSLLDVLALAGGLTDLADRSIFVQRHGSLEKTAYSVTSQRGVISDTNVLINPGDTVLVPKAGVVYILGDVRLPGGYTMTNNEAQLSVLQLLARAGGTNNTAVPAHTRLIRKTNSGKGYEELPLQVSKMQKGKLPDVLLQADDILYIPFSYLRNLATSGAAGIPASLASAAVYRF